MEKITPRQKKSPGLNTGAPTQRSVAVSLTYVLEVDNQETITHTGTYGKLTLTDTLTAAPAQLQAATAAL